MPLDFPTSPTNGQYYNGFVYNSANETWDSAYAPRAATIPISSPNYIINGAFDIWQRGTSLTTTANVYTADRWYGEGGNVTVSRQTAGVPATSTYCMRTAMTSTTFNNKYQIIESINVAPMRGKAVTFQVKLRRNASFAGGLTVRLSKSSTVDAGMGATWVEIIGSVVSNASLPTGTAATDWYLASVTATIPNDGTANTVRVEVSQTIAEVSGAYWEMAEAQLETESLTAFRRNAPSIQGELAACQRYYYRVVGGAAFSAMPVINTGSTNASTILGAIVLPVQMRAFPHTLEAFGLRAVNLKDDWTTAVTNVTLSSGWASLQSPGVTFTTGGGMTPNEFFRIGANNNGGAYIGLSAEL